MLCLLSLSKGISDQEMRAVDTELSGLARQARPDKAVSKAAMASKKSERDPRSFEEAPNLFGSAGTRSHAKRSAASLSHVSGPLAERQAWHGIASPVVGLAVCRVLGSEVILKSSLMSSSDRAPDQLDGPGSVHVRLHRISPGLLAYCGVLATLPMLDRRHVQLVLAMYFST